MSGRPLKRSIAMLALVIAAMTLAGPAEARSSRARLLDADSIETAARPGRGKALDPAIVRVQVILDRLRYGPGVIDGRGGDNLDRAILSFQSEAGLEPTGKLDPATYERIIAATSRPILTRYQITPEDLKGPFVKHIPTSLEAMAKLKRVAYRNAREQLAERFHVDEGLLASLNPGSGFKTAGETITVPEVTRDRPDAKAARIDVLKGGCRLRVLDATDRILAEFPASIGSDEKPAPSGQFAVTAVVNNPSYTYNPKYAFKGVKATKPFEVAPGPNGPVGAVWIDLTAESYGIHGVADPSRIGRSYSHGCVRLTNWDALDLASMIGKGTPVDFVEPATLSSR